MADKKKTNQEPEMQDMTPEEAAAFQEQYKASFEEIQRFFANLSGAQKKAIEFANVFTEFSQNTANMINFANDFYKGVTQSEGWQAIQGVIKSFGSLAQYADKMREFAIAAGAFYEQIEKELQKPEYEGLSAEKLEELSEDPTADPKYKQLWQQAQDNTRAALKEKEEQEKQEQTPREKAMERGAVMTLRNHVTAFSAEDLQSALTGASIFMLPGAAKDFKFDETTGQLNTLSLDTGEKKLLQLTKMHTALLMFVAQSFFLQSDESENGLLSFYVPTICRELNIDAREFSTKREKGAEKPPLHELQAQKLLSLIEPFDPMVGVTEDGSYYRVLAFHGYDKESRTMTISAPYIKRQLEIARSRDLKHSPLNQLFHSSIASEHNQGAVELANRILAGLLRRGNVADPKTYNRKPKKTKQTVTKTDIHGNRTTTTTTFDTTEEPQPQKQKQKIVTYQVSFKGLIADCPQLRADLEAIKQNESNKKTWRQAYNSKLKQAFEAAFRILLEKSDMLNYYSNLDFEPKNPKTKKIQPPTISTLSRKLIITHNGKNKNYSQIIE